MTSFPIPLLGAKCAECEATRSYGRIWKAIQAADSATSLRFDYANVPGRVIDVQVDGNVSVHCVPRAPVAGELVLCGRCQQARSRQHKKRQKSGDDTAAAQAPVAEVLPRVPVGAALAGAGTSAVAQVAKDVPAQVLSGADEGNPGGSSPLDHPTLAGAGADTGKIDINSLPSVPTVFDCAHFGQFMPKNIEETLHDKANATVTKGVHTMLDLADEEMLRQAQTVRTQMFGNPTGVERDLAQALHVNDSATFGCLPEGNKTEGHFHVMGVFNYMIGKRGDGSAKNWSFYELKYPRIEAAREAEAVKPLTQYPGDLVYIPPGWGHEVYTYSGTNKGTRRQHNKYTSHFVSWIMPRDYIGTEQGFAHLAHFMSGRRSEKQSKLKKVDWDKVYGLVGGFAK